MRGEGDRHPVKLNGYDNTVAGWFKIKSVPVEIGGYNLLFCPENGYCGYVGVDIDSSRNRVLVVAQDENAAMWIQFQRVYGSSETAITQATA